MPAIAARSGTKRKTLECGLHDAFYESLFFRIKMASAVMRSRTVALSAERVLESLEQKGDGNDGMSSGEETNLYRQLQ